MVRLTEVVKNLLIINVLVFFAVRYLLPIPNIEQYFVLFHPNTGNFQPIQIVTHMFMHGNESHLLFNMLSLYFLGPYTEEALGSKRFLILYLTAGFVASIAQMLMTQGAIVGASGAIYGVLAAFATMFPNLRLMLLFPPIPIKAKYMALGLIAFGLYSGISGAQAGIGHFAHIGGAVTGFIMVHYWKMANLR